MAEGKSPSVSSLRSVGLLTAAVQCVLEARGEVNDSTNEGKRKNQAVFAVGAPRGKAVLSALGHPF